MAENDQLRERLRDGLLEPEQNVPRQETPGRAVAGLHEQSSSGKHDNPQSVVSGIFISANGDSSYHGLTSTLFDDSRICRQNQAQVADASMPVEPIRKQLMGEAVYQRKFDASSLAQWLSMDQSNECHRADGDVKLPARQVGLGRSGSGAGDASAVAALESAASFVPDHLSPSLHAGHGHWRALLFQITSERDLLWSIKVQQSSRGAPGSDRCPNCWLDFPEESQGAAGQCSGSQ